MITIHRNGRVTTNESAATGVLGRIRSAVTWPFTHRYAAPLWLALRLYVGLIWFQFGINKLQSGWLTSDPIGVIFKYIAQGTLPVPFAPFRNLAAWMFEAGITPYISHAMPFLEMAVGLSFFSGVLVIPAAIGGILLIINIQLSGTGSFAFDMRMIAFHIALILAFRVVSVIGFERLAARILRAALRALPRRQPRPALSAKQ